MLQTQSRPHVLMRLGYFNALFSVAVPALLAVLLLMRGAHGNVSATPYDAQALAHSRALGHADAATRARAAEALGFLRYYAAESALIETLTDASPEARRAAALSLAACGGRASLIPLSTALGDADWTVAQAAWTALTNLTGMETPFDALIEADERQRQLAWWRRWIDALPENDLPEACYALIGSAEHWEVERGLRALGVLGAPDAAKIISDAIAPWVKQEDEDDFDAKARVQAGIRALGRLGVGFDTLEEFLYNRQWAGYAAEALGDYGGDAAAAALMRAFPFYAQEFHRPGNAAWTHPHDKPHLDPSDRILYVPYAIAFALARIPFDDPGLLDDLRAVAPLIAAQIPLDVDGLMVYDEEPFQRIFRFLLERAGIAQHLVELAFDALGVPRAVPLDAPVFSGASTPDAFWHDHMRQAWTEHSATSGDTAFYASPVLRGQDAPLAIEVDISGWDTLHLTVDDVEDYSMDRANWAGARLVTKDGGIIWLDTVTPLSATQQHDTLRVNVSASYGNLRIADQQFERGLHTHAISHITYHLGGAYLAFRAHVGVCASRPAGQGSVRFLVSNEEVHQRSADHPLAMNAAAVWEEAERNARTPAARRQVAWEREDMDRLWLPGEADAATMTQRYIAATRPPFREAARELRDKQPDDNTLAAARELYYRSRIRENVEQLLGHGAIASNVLTALCRNEDDAPALVELLDHDNHWVRINAVKTLIFMDARDMVDAISRRLRDSKPEAEYGYFDEVYFARAQGWDELNDPTPRYREALIMALGMLGAAEHVPLLVDALFNERNALEIQYRAVNALDMLGGDVAMEALRRAEREHPYHSVRIAAREALWKRRIAPLPRIAVPEAPPARVTQKDLPEKYTRFVFIKGDPAPYNPFQMDSWRQAYMTTDSGPTYRPGRNLYILDVTGETSQSMPLTHFEDGYVADCEVSYDGQRILFSRREEHSPWWHIYEIQADGGGLRALTQGPYHHVQPNFLPNGRIVFATSRLGMRDEYHGYLCTGLATMTPDGDDIQVIGFNFGRDAEPTVAPDGKILFTRLELFYSRMKTEWNLISAFPDGTNMQTLYGPERRGFWSGIHGGYGGWTVSGDRHRQLRLTQPRALANDAHLLTTPAGPIVTRGRHGETLLRARWLREGGNDTWVITTPYPLDATTLLVAAGEKQNEFVADQFPRDAVDLGLYRMDIATGALSLLYNDPAVADFEARPLHPRVTPQILVESPAARGSGFTGTLYADSVFITQIDAVRERGRLLRVIEAEPQVARHATHTTGDLEAWKNHGGAFARVLGTLPLAADGSFAVEVPADRLLHLQVLDSNRRVVGNQQVWMHVRPGERKGCIGCHERPDSAAATRGDQLTAFQTGAIPKALPDGSDQLRYRAKIWFKGYLPDEREERQRTVQSINWFGRN